MTVPSGTPLDYATTDVPPEEDHDEPYRSEHWYGCLLATVLMAGLVLAAFAIKEVMIWLM